MVCSESCADDVSTAEREARIQELADDMRKLYTLQPTLTQEEIDEEIKGLPRRTYVTR